MERTLWRCSNGLLNLPARGHRRVPVLIDSSYMRECEQEWRCMRVAHGSRSVGVCRCGRLAGDESSGLCLDLVEGEVDRREVRSREMGVERPGRVEEGREVRSYVGRHSVVVVVEVSVFGICGRRRRSRQSGRVKRACLDNTLTNPSRNICPC